MLLTERFYLNYQAGYKYFYQFVPDFAHGHMFIHFANKLISDDICYRNFLTIHLKLFFIIAIFDEF